MPLTSDDTLRRCDGCGGVAERCSHDDGVGLCSILAFLGDGLIGLSGIGSVELLDTLELSVAVVAFSLVMVLLREFNRSMDVVKSSISLIIRFFIDENGSWPSN